MTPQRFRRSVKEHPDVAATRIDYALAALRMTYGEAHALAVERVAERMGGASRFKHGPDLLWARVEVPEPNVSPVHRECIDYADVVLS
jgi:hypothetical protein